MPFLAAVPAAIGTVMTASTASAAALASASATLSATSLAVGAVGAGVAGLSAYQQQNYQAKIAQQNSSIAQQNAATAQTEGTVAESAAKEATGRKVGAALAAQGANGIDVGFGSPEAHRGALQNEGNLDAMTIHYNATKSALAYLGQSSEFSAQASADKAGAFNTALTTPLNVGASFISGASSLTGKALATKQAFGSSTSSAKGI